jgi:hypothetical protein
MPVALRTCRIVPTAQAMCHRRIPVIQQSSAGLTECAGRVTTKGFKDSNAWRRRHDPIGRPEEVENVALFLASEASST